MAKETIKGKIVIITGATSGIGEATAKLLAKEGAVTVFAGRRQDRLDKLRAESVRQLQPEDIADAVLYAVTQPDYVDVNEVLIRPTDQQR